MSVKSATINCDWPGCAVSSDLEWNVEGPVYGSHPDGKPNWTHLNSPTGTHVCHAHLGKSLKDINDLRAKLKQAAPAADAILKGLVRGISGAMKLDEAQLIGAKAAFDYIYPGCDDAWKLAVKKAVQR